MDRDKIVGGVLALGLFVSYIFYSKNHSKPNEDTLKQVVQLKEEKFDDYSNNFENKNLNFYHEDDIFLQNSFFADKFISNETSEKFVLENDDLKIVFDTNGGRIYDVFLKNEINNANLPVQLVAGKNGASGFKFKFRNKIINTNDLIFVVDKENSDSQKITFVCDLGSEKIIKQTYFLNEKGFVVDHRWSFINSNQFLDSKVINFVWDNILLRQETDRDYCQKKTTINYLTSENKFNGLNEISIKTQSTQIPAVKWIAMKQRFFTIGIDGLNNFKNASLTLNPNNDDNFLKNVNINVQISETEGKSAKDLGGDIRYFFGPNDLNLLKTFSYKFDKNLYLGFPVVRQINEYIFLPFISFLHKYICDVILLILILILVVKFLILPLTLKSYISMAEMRLLNPAITLLREKYKNQPEVFQLEQMKLFQEMGIKPLGGCLPMLLQMPIFIAMFTLIPNLNFLRHKSFLWVEDWTSFDSILNLPFNIPFYGSHISLFALLMTISSIAFSVLNSKSAPANPQMGGQMRLMNYFLPLTFLFVMNSFPAALTMFYFFSNLFTIAQQFLTAKFIDDEKIKRKIEERKAKIKNTGSAFNEKIQQVINFQKKSK